MPLEEYKRKRDFKKTPEPPPAKPAARKGFSYLIQKHDATRLHYDLRLELDGVLLSWAVTKGPSLNPADKRLAVHVEDHPLSYGTFEGTIPKGEYGGGTVMLWDRGTWEPEFDPHFGMQKGHLAFILHGERLKGGWDLVRMHGGREKGDSKRDNWLLIKKKDSYAKDAADAEKFLEDANTSISTGRTMDEIAVDAPPEVIASAAKSRQAKSAPKKKESSAELTRPKDFGRGLQELMRDYPHVELATLTDRPPEGDAWLHEIKFDGYRLLAFLSQGDVRLRTRNGNDWTLKFPSLYASVSKLKAKNAVLDMEAVVLDHRGKSSFQALQRALGEEGTAQTIQAYVFDLLHLDGKSLVAMPLTDRKQALQALLKKSKLGVRSAGSTWSQRKDAARDEEEHLHFSDHIVGTGAETFAKACEMGLEGIVSKRVASHYEPGRQKSWLKSKCALRQEFIIIGFTAARSGGRAIGALHLGYYKEGQLTYAGKVGTGFSMRDAQDLYDRLVKLEIPAAHAKNVSPAANVPRSMLKGARWVQPSLLCEVAFTEWTGDGHIRQPSFLGLREDKSPKQVRMENPIHLAQSRKRGTSETKSRQTKSPKGKIAQADTSRAVSDLPAAVAARSAPKNPGSLEVLGVTISHPDRVLFDDVGLTKGQLAQYYAAVAPWILKDIAGHPLSVIRCPDGISKECFFQRSPNTGLGADIKPYRWRHKGKFYDYFYIDNEKGLIELVQMASIELHPWAARAARIDFPDRLIFDLDPDESVPFDAVKLAAEDLRRRLQEKGLKSLLKVTGGKGLHVTAPLAEKNDWKEVKAFCAALAAEMVKEVPSAYIATMTKTKRTGKIFVDYFRNDYTATAIADFSVRARPGAPVAVPLEWSELRKLRSANQFTIADVLKRIRTKTPDPARHNLRQKLPRN